MALGLTACLAPLPARASGGPVAVDVELVLAVDISRSMDADEQRLQRDGYVEALRSGEFFEALKSGVQGKVALAYLEWAGPGDQWVVLPFTLIDNEASARAFAAQLAAAPIGRLSRTSISGAIRAAMKLFENNGFDGARRVIDISGDGPNNAGGPVEAARDEAIARGFVINGLPLLLKSPTGRWGEIADLDLYYEDCVIGGPGAFSLPIHDRAQFLQATRSKIVQELAAAPAPLLRRVKARAARVDCMIGEKLWRRGWDP